MKYLTDKQYLVMLLVMIGWIGLTYLIRFVLNWWEFESNIMILPMWIFIGYQLIHLRHTIKTTKVKQKG
jgi:small-conductance mechanosensitive channel